MNKLTQRDRLAAVLHEADRERWPNAPDDEGWYWEWMADALLARGVRVVDVETLAAAIGTDHFRRCDDGCGFSEFTDGRNYAERLISAIDETPCLACDEGGDHS